MTRAESVREAAGMQSAMTYIGRWQETVTHWAFLRTIYLKSAQARRDTREEVAGGTYGGVKRQQKNNSGKPWQGHGKTGLGDNRGMESCSGNQGKVDAEQERQDDGSETSNNQVRE